MLQLVSIAIIKYVELYGIAGVHKDLPIMALYFIEIYHIGLQVHISYVLYLPLFIWNM